MKALPVLVIGAAGIHLQETNKLIGGERFNDIEEFAASLAQKEKEATDPKKQETGANKPAADLPFEGYKPVKQILSDNDSSKLVEKLISRPDGLAHLLLSDVNSLLLSIQQDFPEYAKVSSIG